MESAMMSLTEFLEPARGTLPSTELRSWDVRHHLSLDIAAGIEVMHKHNIVHGDIKPDNVLIFMQDNPVVPFVAKLSDFGVCIDMGNPTREDRRFRA
jgi:serine/threonine protein kinase